MFVLAKERGAVGESGVFIKLMRSCTVSLLGYAKEHIGFCLRQLNPDY